MTEENYKKMQQEIGFFKARMKKDAIEGIERAKGHVRACSAWLLACLGVLILFTFVDLGLDRTFRLGASVGYVAVGTAYAYLVNRWLHSQSEWQRVLEAVENDDIEVDVEG